MIDLGCNYLGLELESPLVPSSSPLMRSFDAVRELEDAGAAAVVLHSLFEEEIEHEDELHIRFILEQSIGHAEAESYLPQHGTHTRGVDRYLEHLRRVKGALRIPVVASLNGVTPSGWIEHGRLLQEAGADALELNVYQVAHDPTRHGSEVESHYLELLSELRRHVSIPVAMKLSPQFSALPYFVKALEGAGAAGVSLFNRFYQPDIDIESMKLLPRVQLSSSSDSLLAMRWIGILHGRTRLTLAATGGIHTAEDVIKMVMAGADVTHLCSTLLQLGSGQLTNIRIGLEQWLEDHGYDSLQQIHGVMSHQYVDDPGLYERANYLWVLDSYTPGGGVQR